jgi:hypothetical protein
MSVTFRLSTHGTQNQRRRADADLPLQNRRLHEKIRPAIDGVTVRNW